MDPILIFQVQSQGVYSTLWNQITDLVQFGYYCKIFFLKMTWTEHFIAYVLPDVKIYMTQQTPSFIRSADDFDIAPGFMWNIDQIQVQGFFLPSKDFISLFTTIRWHFF